MAGAVRLGPTARLAGWQKVANYVFNNPFKSIVGTVLPLYGAIFYRESTHPSTKDMLLSQRLIHTRVYGQMIAVCTVGVVMTVTEAMKADGAYVVEGDRVLYHGCGSGLIGLLALRHGAAHVRFADVDEGAVRAAAANAAAAGYERGRQWCASRGDLDDKPPKSVRFADLVQFADVDVVLCNPPQMPGPEALAAARPDKYGGADGAHFYRRLAAHGAALLGDGGRVVFLQTSFSSFAAVDALFGAAGFGVRTLKTQKRSASLAAIDALAPGCATEQCVEEPGNAAGCVNPQTPSSAFFAPACVQVPEEYGTSSWVAVMPDNDMVAWGIDVSYTIEVICDCN